MKKNVQEVFHPKIGPQNFNKLAMHNTVKITLIQALR